MKKFIILFLMIVFLAGCGVNQKEDLNSKEQKTQQAIKEEINDDQEVSTEQNKKYLLKVYENKQYGFKLKYPKSWTFSDRDIETYGGILSLAFRSPKNQKLIESAQAKINADKKKNIPNTKDSNAYFVCNDVEITIFNKNPFQENSPVDKKIGEITIDNKKATEYWIGGYGSYYGFVVENDGLFFKFEFKGCDTERCIKNRALSEELNHILNSFEFTTSEIAKIVQKIKVWCSSKNISECSTISDYSIVDFSDKYSVVKINNFSYLLTKKENGWNVSIVSQEKNICDTGSDNVDLATYCKDK